MKKFALALLVCEVTLVFVVVQAALRFSHFRSVRRLLFHFASAISHMVCPVGPDQVVRIVEWTKSKLQSDGGCLAAALTAEALLLQFGHKSVLCIGAKLDGSNFQAHAWIERDDVVVVGGPQEWTREYTRFPGIPV